MSRNRTWLQITPIQNIPEQEGRQVKIGALDLAVFNLGTRVVAMENRCPHQGGPIVDGIVSSLGEKVTVTCPMHARRICMDTGEIVKPAGTGACLRTLPAKVEGGIVLVDIGPMSSMGQDVV